jgi:hypothetical protein
MPNSRRPSTRSGFRDFHLSLAVKIVKIILTIGNKGVPRPVLLLNQWENAQ